MRLFEPMLLEECACQMVHGEESASMEEPHLATVASLTEVICHRLQHQTCLLSLLLCARQPAERRFVEVRLIPSMTCRPHAAAYGKV